MADHIGALNSLLRSTGIEDHDEALRLADAAIKASKPGSSDDHLLTAHHTKVVALLKLDRFDDALRAIAAAGTKLEDQVTLEKGYALYKSGQLEEAQTVLKKAAQGREPPRGIKHVAAQVAYRAENFERSADIYRDLVAAAEEGLIGEENDLRINLLATNAQLEWQGSGHLVPQSQKQPGREELEAFETAYNAACGCLARGDFAKAAMLLKRSRDLCEASEDLSDEEKKAELVPIIVQQAYVSTKLGKLEEAAALQNAVVVPE
jgi:signal recognition particle subunit SRP72